MKKIILGMLLVSSITFSANEWLVDKYILMLKDQNKKTKIIQHNKSELKKHMSIEDFNKFDEEINKVEKTQKIYIEDLDLLKEVFMDKHTTDEIIINELKKGESFDRYYSMLEKIWIKK